MLEAVDTLTRDQNDPSVKVTSEDSKIGLTWEPSKKKSLRGKEVQFQRRLWQTKS